MKGVTWRLTGVYLKDREPRFRTGTTKEPAAVALKARVDTVFAMDVPNSSGTGREDQSVAPEIVTPRLGLKMPGGLRQALIARFLCYALLAQ